jgi:hypothetical protein
MIEIMAREGIVHAFSGYTVDRSLSQRYQRMIGMPISVTGAVAFVGKTKSGYFYVETRNSTLVSYQYRPGS